MSPRRVRILILASLSVSAPISHNLFATDYTVTLNASGTTLWSSLPWSPAGIPATGDNATLNISGNLTVDLTTTYASSSRLQNVVANSNSGILSFNQSADFFATAFTLANTGSVSFTQTSNTFNVSNNINLGQSVGSHGAYSLSGGTLTTNIETLGIAGSATMTQTGGTQTISTLELAHTTGSSALFSLSGTGSLIATSIILRPNSTFTQTAGSLSFHDVTQSGGLASFPSLNLAGTSTYNLSGGSLTLGSLVLAGNLSHLNWTAGTLNFTQNLEIDPAASASASSFSITHSQQSLAATNLLIGTTTAGSFTQSAGLATFPGVYLGYNPSTTGSYSLSGSASLNSQLSLVGYQGTGSFTQSGGTHTVSNYLELGTSSGATGFYSLSNSSAVLSTTNTLVGYQSIGSFTQSGGTHSVSDSLSLGTTLGATGFYSLSGAAVLSTTNTLVGDSDAGTFLQSGGTHSVSDNLSIGTTLGATGFYSLSGTAVLSTANTLVGDSGTGTFLQSGGTHSVSSHLELGGQSGFYSLSGTGSLSTHELDDGYDGPGSFSQSGGTHSVSSLLTIGYYPGSNSSYSLSGGTLTNAGATIVSFDDNYSTFTQSGNSTHTTADLVLADGSPNAHGTYLLQSGSLSAGSEEIGQDGTATFTHTAGSNSVTTDLSIAQNASATGSYFLSGGSLTVAHNLFVGGDPTGPGGSGTLVISSTASASVAGTLTVYNTPGTLFRMTGGSLTINSLVLNSHPENFSFTGGNLTINSGYTVNSNFAVGGVLTLSADATLSSPSPVTNNATIILSGGTLAGSGTLLNQGLIAGSGTISSSLLNPANGTILVPASSTLTITKGIYLQSVGTITLNGGTLNNGSQNLTNNGVIQGHGALAATPNLINNSSISITGGALTFAGSLTGIGSLYIDPSSSFSSQSGISQSLLNLAGSLTLTGSPSSINTISLTGSLDLTGQPLTTSTPLDTLRQYLYTGQLFSSSSNSFRTLAYSTAGVVQLAHFGDTNLDGQVNADDYAILDKNFAKHLTDPHWQDGDFNYDGIISSADYLIIDRAYLLQSTPPSPTFLAQRESQFGQAYVQQLLSTLPEPSLLTACGLALPLLRTRRRSPLVISH
jgi:hypothetical protein